MIYEPIRSGIFTHSGWCTMYPQACAHTHSTRCRFHLLPAALPRSLHTITDLLTADFATHPTLFLVFSLTLYFVLLILAHSYRPVIQLLSSPLCSSPLLSSDFSSLCSSLHCCRGVSTKSHHCQPAKLPLLFSVLLVCVCICVLLRHLSLFLYRRYNPGFRLTQSKLRRVIEIGLAAV